MQPRCGGSRRSEPPWLTIFILALLLTAQPSAVPAHALVIASLPAANSTVDGAALTIDLQFNSRIDRKRARLRLVPPSGEPQELSLASDDSPDHLRARSAALAPGDYRVEWYVVSPDGHVTRGNVPFQVTAP